MSSRRLTSIGGGTFLILAAGSGALLSCSDSGDGAETTSAALNTKPVTCSPTGATPTGYPQRRCFFLTPPGGALPKETCLCYPPDTITDADLAYQVITVLHAPPGNMSSVTYATGSTVGSVEQITSTDQSGYTLDVSINTPGGGADSETKWTSGTVSGTQNSFQVVSTSTIGIADTTNLPAAGAYDEVYVWLNAHAHGDYSPITNHLTLTITPRKVMYSPSGQLVSSIGPNGQPTTQVEKITTSALANPALRTPSETGFFGHLTSAQIAEILSLDDFYNNPSFNPANDPAGYRYVQTLELDGPELGSPVVPIAGATVEYDSQNDTIDGTASHLETTIKAGPSFSIDGGITFGVQYGDTFTWDYNDTRTNVQGTQKAAAVTLQSSTPCVHASVDMYLDLAFGSWVGVPHFTNYSCAIDDPPVAGGVATTCTVGGQTMHCCPTGYAMVGARLDQDVFKCAPLQNATGAITLDTGTQRFNMHSCPYGQVMVGLNVALNDLACQALPAGSITSERIDPGTQDSYPMHVCDATFLTEAMSGIRVDQNLLNCATNPHVQ